MIPSTFIELDTLPLTTNGKLDSRALPAPEFVNKESYVAPQTDFEHKLCTIWQDVLDVERVGIQDDFFRIGGNSIRAIKLLSRMTPLFSKNITLFDIFNRRTIARLCTAMTKSDKHDKPSLVNFFNKPSDQQKLFFIPPGLSGCEVYENLAQGLKHRFNCIGLDNYNIVNKKKVSSLKTLANLYIKQIKSYFHTSKPIYLLGWSLGGQISLEMAYQLEKKGYKNIQVFLLDTILND